jgi:hypothetical protein
MVEQCSCGMVHVTIGGVTLRLAPQVLTQLATVMSEAARMMVLRDAFSPSVRDEVLS